MAVCAGCIDLVVAKAVSMLAVVGYVLMIVCDLVKF